MYNYTLPCLVHTQKSRSSGRRQGLIFILRFCRFPQKVRLRNSILVNDFRWNWAKIKRPWSRFKNYFNFCNRIRSFELPAKYYCNFSAFIHKNKSFTKVVIHSGTVWPILVGNALKNHALSLLYWRKTHCNYGRSHKKKFLLIAACTLYKYI